MAKISVPKALTLDPADSQEQLVGIELPNECDGSICRNVRFDESAGENDPPAHVHLVERGRAPEAGPRYYAIWLKTKPEG